MMQGEHGLETSLPFFMGWVNFDVLDIFFTI